MDLGIKGRRALVAAGSKGIGLAAALALQAEGCEVSVCGRSAGSLKAAAQLGLDTFPADVRKPADIESWFKQTGLPEILVTNTGGPPAGSWQSLTDEQWQEGFESTLMNVVRMVRLAAPAMQENGWGRIVHITSLVAKEPSVMLPISSTLRGGLMNLVRLQAVELAEFGITVNGILPGHTLTDRQRHLADIRAKRDGITADEALVRQASEVPMKRLAQASEIGDATAFLCSERAAYITGVNLLVDGGLTRGPG